MNKFIIEFTGRKVGAIGITYPCKVTVSAMDKESAMLKLYDHYEHISHCYIEEVSANPGDSAAPAA